MASPGTKIGGVTTSHLKYALWRSPDQRLRVEFPQVLLNEIRAAVVQGAHSPRGQAEETGGILLGTRLESLVRVLAWTPIECQRAFGPNFLLSGQDEDRLQAQLEELARRSDRTGLHPVGWFVSKLQGELEPSPDHRRLHASHFLQSQKLLLVCQPDLLGDARLLINVRYENEDRLTTYPNPLMLEAAVERGLVKRHPGQDANPAVASRSSRWTRARTTAREGYVPPEIPSAIRQPESQEGLPSPKTAWWAGPAMLVATIFLLTLGGALWLKNQGLEPAAWALERSGAGRWLQVSALQPWVRPSSIASLHASRTSGQLQLTWDPAGLLTENAVEGVVEVRAGGSIVARLSLRDEALLSGKTSLELVGTAQEVRFSYRTADGRAGEELLRIVSASR